jgi:outer membrane protein assembly factor BamB
MIGTMLRRIGKALMFALGLLAVTAGALYFAGARIILDGGGFPRIRFVQAPDEQAERIARHREAQRAEAQSDAQRAEAPPAAVTGPDLAAAAPAAAPAVPADASAGVPAAAPDRPASTYWTDFRGPHRDGHYRQQSVNTAWPPAGLTPLWKQPVGGGYASFVVARGRAFTIEQRGGEEVVAAYDPSTGRELWTNSWPALFSERMGGDGPRATPTWADGKVYALGATGELRALDEASGRTTWRTNILDDADASNLPWGMAASPLVVDDTVVVLPGGSNGRSVVAYDRSSGRRAWSALDDQQAYSSPMLVTIAEVRQILVLTASRLVGLTTDGSGILWEFPWRTSNDINASQPLLVGGNRIFVSSGYGTGAAMIELSATGGRFSVRELWRNTRMKNRFSSSVLHDGFIYGLDESILACVDAATGDLRWKGGRYGYGQVLLASGHLIVLTEDGDMVLVRATPGRHEEVARFPAIEGKTWNHPAMSDGLLLVRNLNEMAGFSVR